MLDILKHKTLGMLECPIVKAIHPESLYSDFVWTTSPHVFLRLLNPNSGLMT
jgi:hypothetical protein